MPLFEIPLTGLFLLLGNGQAVHCQGPEGPGQRTCPADQKALKRFLMGDVLASHQECRGRHLASRTLAHLESQPGGHNFRHHIRAFYRLGSHCPKPRPALGSCDLYRDCQGVPPSGSDIHLVFCLWNPYQQPFELWFVCALLYLLLTFTFV